MIDLSKFEFFKKGKNGSHKAGAIVTIYAHGSSSISSEIGGTLAEKIDIGLTSDGLQMCIKNGSMFAVRADGRSVNYSNAKKFSASKVKQHIENCNIEFPATYSFIYTEGVWIGELQQQEPVQP